MNDEFDSDDEQEKEAGTVLILLSLLIDRFSHWILTTDINDGSYISHSATQQHLPCVGTSSTTCSLYVSEPNFIKRSDESQSPHEM